MHAKFSTLFGLTLAAGLLVTPACKKDEAKKADDDKQAQKAGADEDADEGAGAAALKADKGVDAAQKRITVGALNEESGPAAGIGKPFAVGKRILAEHVNAGGSGILPEGWKIELVERDHGYNPQKAVQSYNEIKDQVLFIATSFGTPTTLPLRPMLERDQLMAFPASLSSKMAEHEMTPPAGPAYSFEAMRAMDWAVEDVGGSKAIRAGIVYQQDDYGEDGLAGWKKAAEKHGAEIVSEQAIAPTQTDFTAVVTSLKKAEANYVLLTTLPKATGAILGKAAQLQYQPVWLGNTPAWVDVFFDAEVLPPQVLANFHWVTGLPYWGEDVSGMKEFMGAYEKYKPEGTKPDFYILVSYLQGLAELEAAKRAIDSGDVTREGYKKALHSMESFDAGGLIQPTDYSKVPYVPGTKTRVLKPKLEERTWEQVADYAEPKAHE